MAYTQMLRIDRIGPDELDLLLARGFFRMHQGVFTCTFLNDEDGLHSVVWTRRPLQGVPLPVQAQRRLRKVRSAFTIEVGPCRLDAEREGLYSRYFEHKGGNRSETLRGVLFGDEAVDAAEARVAARRGAEDDAPPLDDVIDALLDELASQGPHSPTPGAQDEGEEPTDDLPTTPTGARAFRAGGRLPGDRFDTWEVSIRDGGRLVGYSIFDIGRDSIESIVGIYDPDYRRHGLGVATLFAEIDWGAAAGFSWHYAGYIVPGVDAFEYKRDVGHLEFWDAEAELWRPIAALDEAALPGRRIEAAIDAAESALLQAGYLTERLLNSTYRVVQLNNGAHQFIGEPWLLRWGSGGVQRIITYDLHTRRYHLDLCVPTRDLSHVLPTPEQRSHPCMTRLLHRIKRIGSTSRPAELARLLEASQS